MPFLPSREGQLTEEQLKWGYWWVTHKILLKKILMFAIGIFGVLTMAYAIYGFADWFFGSGVLERFQIGQMATQPTGYQAIQQASRPQQLNIDSPTVLVSGSGSYDLIVPVKNPNASWWVDLTWHFTSDGSPTGRPQRSFVLPGSATYLVQLGFKSDGMPGGVDLVVDNLTWRRLDRHLIRPDYPSWSGERLDFLMSDVEFKPPADDDMLQVSRVTFNVRNNTGYSYWRVGFFVTLWGGGNLVGINHVTVGELMAGTTRSVDASWFTALPQVTRVEVIPEINIFDTAVFMPVRN